MRDPGSTDLAGAAHYARDTALGYYGDGPSWAEIGDHDPAPNTCREFITDGEHWAFCTLPPSHAGDPHVGELTVTQAGRVENFVVRGQKDALA